MPKPLMPKATAVWLIENTTLTFEQIADFCGLHSLEVQGIADEEVAIGIIGANPIEAGELILEEIERCQGDPSARLVIVKPSLPMPVARAKGPRYTPVAKRQDRPDAIAWLLSHHSELSDAQMSRLVGTTKPTIAAIRERTHWNIQNLKPQSPVKFGLCTHTELQNEIEKAERAEERRKAREARAAKAAAGPQSGETAEAESETAAETPAPTTRTLPGAWQPHLPATTAPDEETDAALAEDERMNGNG